MFITQMIAKFAFPKKKTKQILPNSFDFFLIQVESFNHLCSYTQYTIPECLRSGEYRLPVEERRKSAVLESFFLW